MFESVPLFFGEFLLQWLSLAADRNAYNDVLIPRVKEATQSPEAVGNKISFTAGGLSPRPDHRIKQLRAAKCVEHETRLINMNQSLCHP